MINFQLITALDTFCAFNTTHSQLWLDCSVLSHCQSQFSWKKSTWNTNFYAFQMLRISPRRRISSGLYLLLWTVSPPLYPVRASRQRTEYLPISTAVTPSKSDSIEREASRVVVPMLIDANVVKKSRQIFLSATFFSKNEFGNPAFEERNKIVFFPKPLSQIL